MHRVSGWVGGMSAAGALTSFIAGLEQQASGHQPDTLFAVAVLLAVIAGGAALGWWLTRPQADAPVQSISGSPGAVQAGRDVTVGRDLNVGVAPPATRYADPDGLALLLTQIRIACLDLERRWRAVGRSIGAEKPIDDTNVWLADARYAISSSELGEVMAARIDTDGILPIRNDVLPSAVTWPPIVEALQARAAVLDRMIEEVSRR